MISHKWKEIPIFISSSFQDLHAERDYLQSLIFPELQERLRARRCWLEPVDLRIGVETLSVAELREKQLLILKVCFGEIRRAQPLLLVILGDRFGWIPPEEHLADSLTEAGFETNPKGKSLTTLEIEYGLQHPNCMVHVYFREPLPDHEMPPEIVDIFSDSRSADPLRRKCVRRMQQLKEWLRRRVKSERIHAYQASWNPVRQQVEGLESWGQSVLENLWHDLDRMTQDRADTPIGNWQDAERQLFQDFLGRKTRHFLCRDIALSHVLQFLDSPQGPRVPRALLLSAEPGTGKSSLFARVAQDVSKRFDQVLLFVAGCGPRSVTANDLIRLWIGQLCGWLSRNDPTTTKSSDTELEHSFHQLLTQAASHQRVLLLIDAIDQLEPTIRAQTLAWLPQELPENVRLFATILPGRLFDFLRARAGFFAATLPALNREEGILLISMISARYRRSLHPEVIDILLGSPSYDASGWINPLWLELALESLHRLRGTELLRLSENYSGTPEEKLHAYLLDTAKSLPRDIPGLYKYIVDEVAGLYGPEMVNGFLRLLAASRFGWRLADLRAMLPRLTDQPWDESRFAAVRRAFVNHIEPIGSEGEWNFTHKQFRDVISSMLNPDDMDFITIHRCCAEHLQETPNDPMKLSELMYHYSQGRMALQGAYYLLSDLSEIQLAQIAYPLSRRLNPEADPDQNTLNFLACMLDIIVLSSKNKIRLAHIFNHMLIPLLNAEGNTIELNELLSTMMRSLENIRRSKDVQEEAELELATALEHFGDLAMTNQQFDEAKACYAKSLAFRNRHEQQPLSQLGAWNQAVLYIRIGDVNFKESSLKEAQVMYHSAQDRLQYIIDQKPEAGSYRREMSLVLERLGDIDLRTEKIEPALQNYHASLAIRQELVQAHPDRNDWRRDLAVARNKLGESFESLGRFQEAVEQYRSSLDLVQELTHREPTIREWQRDLMLGHMNLGDCCRKLKETNQAMSEYTRAVNMSAMLLRIQPESLAPACDHVVLTFKIAQTIYQAGDSVRASDMIQEVMTTLAALLQQHERLTPEAQQLYDQLRRS